MTYVKDQWTGSVETTSIRRLGRSDGGSSGAVVGVAGGGSGDGAPVARGPVFGRRRLRTIKLPEIAAWVADLDGRIGPSTAPTAFLALHGTLEIAVMTRPSSGNRPRASGRGIRREVWENCRRER